MAVEFPGPRGIIFCSYYAEGISGMIFILKLEFEPDIIEWKGSMKI